MEAEKKRVSTIVMFVVLIAISTVGCVTDTPPEGDRTMTGNVEQGDEPAMNGYTAMRYSDKRYDYDLPFRLSVPEDYQAGGEYPLVVILHGAGNKGNDNLRQLTMTSTRLFAGSKVQGRYPSLVLAPQCPQDDQWLGSSRSGDRRPLTFDDVEPSPSYAMLMGLLNRIEDQYSIDTSRIYLTGQSMGGAGTWYTALANPGRFAAIAPICGWGHTEVAANIADLPVWAFHGSDDTTIPPEGSRRMVKALQDAGSTVVKYTEYPGVGHESWELAYRDDEDGDGEVDLIAWMFSQTRLLDTCQSTMED